MPVVAVLWYRAFLPGYKRMHFNSFIYSQAQWQVINTDDDEDNNKCYLFLWGKLSHRTIRRQQPQSTQRQDYLQEKLLRLLHQMNYSACFHSYITTICPISQEAFKKKKDVFNCRFDPCCSHSYGSVTWSDEFMMSFGTAVSASGNGSHLDMSS